MTPKTDYAAQSEGLQMYRERCSDRFPESLRGRTWYEQSDWVETNVSQASLCEMYVQLLKDFRPLPQDDGQSPEGRLADEISDIAGILWRAMDEESRALTEAAVAALPREGGQG